MKTQNKIALFLVAAFLIYMGREGMLKAHAQTVSPTFTDPPLEEYPSGKCLAFVAGHKVPVDCQADNRDVPAKEFQEEEPIASLPMDTAEYDSLFATCAKNHIICRQENDKILMTFPRASCEDKHRFKLQSEDGKWHCLTLP